jgi:hypothetical protein
MVSGSRLQVAGVGCQRQFYRHLKTDTFLWKTASPMQQVHFIVCARIEA